MFLNSCADGELCSEAFALHSCFRGTVTSVLLAQLVLRGAARLCACLAVDSCASSASLSCSFVASSRSCAAPLVAVAVVVAAVVVAAAVVAAAAAAAVEAQHLALGP